MKWSPAGWANITTSSRPASTPETDAATHEKYTKRTHMKWKVFKDGKHLATSSTKAEAERLAEYLGGEVC